MHPFSYINAKTAVSATGLLPGGAWKDANVRVIAGGTDLIDELKERLITPDKIVNLKTIPGLNGIKASATKIVIGSMATMADLESHAIIKAQLKVLAEAARSVAGPQIRNVGTLGGNLCQRPRCWYYRGSQFPCLKKGGSKCYAVDGNNKYHALFGGDPSFIVHPSDCALALVALGAKATVLGPTGKRELLLAHTGDNPFFVLPSRNATRENVLRPNEIITEITVPVPKAGSKSGFWKLREKGSLDFALVSVAAVVTLVGGKIADARVVLGGVAPVPWRSEPAEAALRGKAPSAAVILAAAEAAVKDAKPMRDNGYKITLTKVLVKRALGELTGIKV